MDRRRVGQAKPETGAHQTVHQPVVHRHNHAVGGVQIDSTVMCHLGLLLRVLVKRLLLQTSTSVPAEETGLDDYQVLNCEWSLGNRTENTRVRP
mgnify:CR=1 FL=1